MTRGLRSCVTRAPVRAVLAVALMLAGCVYYPTVKDVAGAMIRPEHGRAVREGDRTLFYVDLASTGTTGDVLTSVRTPLAQQAQIVSATGAPVDRLAVPGATIFRLGPGGPYVLLSGLTRELRPGDTVIVTLTFEKTGNVGVIAAVE